MPRVASLIRRRKSFQFRFHLITNRQKNYSFYSVYLLSILWDSHLLLLLSILCCMCVWIKYLVNGSWTLPKVYNSKSVKCETRNGEEIRTISCTVIHWNLSFYSILANCKPLQSRCCESVANYIMRINNNKPASIPNRRIYACKIRVRCEI